MLLNRVFILIFETLVYLSIAPGVLGVLRLVKARLQGRQGPPPYQTYLDLWKYFHRRSVIPESASWVFHAAPSVVFGCLLLLGVFTPIFYLGSINSAGSLSLNWYYADMLALIYILGLARFAIALAGMDSGSPFGGLGSSREMFINFLVEPSLFLCLYALALNAGTSNLSGIIWRHIEMGPGFMFREPALLLVGLALCLILLAEAGRLPVDNPATHLELTMTGKAIQLEYSGPHMALLEWAEAMRLTLFMTLLLNLFLPVLLANPQQPWLMQVLLVIAYPFKLFVFILLLAIWEMLQTKLRLRSLPRQAGVALVFSILAVLVMVAAR
jgi:formate hydrogenlyase subunit 4